MCNFQQYRKLHTPLFLPISPMESCRFSIKKTKRKKFCLILLFFPLSDLFLHQFLDKILYFSSSQAAYYMLQNTSSNCFSWYNDIKKLICFISLPYLFVFQVLAMTFFTLTIIFRHYFFHNIATYIKIRTNTRNRSDICPNYTQDITRNLLFR